MNIATGPAPRPTPDHQQGRKQEHTPADCSADTPAATAAARQPHAPACPSPFDLENDDAYLAWRENKLRDYPRTASDLLVTVKDLANPTARERDAIVSRCARANMAIYETSAAPGDSAAIRRQLRSFMTHFGLNTLEAHRSADNDGIVALEVANTGTRKGYIPYTNRPLSWHTDGYYNQPDATIGSMVLHCVRDATQGGENALLDPEIAYIRLRDTSKDLIRALMHAKCLTIPPNVEANGTVRDASVGPVFSVEGLSGALQMRYSARKRNIVWRDDANSTAAANALIALVASSDDIITHRLKPGQGLISNNVLHNRSGFTDIQNESGQGRLYYRARFLDRIAGS